LARTIYTYQPVPVTSNTALGVKLPLNKGVVGGRTATQNYASGSAEGAGVFESSYDNIEQAITNLKSLLLTRTSERLMQPDLGTDIYNALFDNMSDDLEEYLQTNIKEKIAFWLPYIKLNSLRLFENNDKGSYLIQMRFTVNPQGANIVINLLAGNENLQIIENTNAVPIQSNLVEASTFTGASLTGGTPLVGVDPVNPGNNIY
jgi:phage baseplate assembly protein W